MTNNTMISCSFKMAYTCLTKTYNFRRNMHISNFSSQLKANLRRDFNLIECHIVDTDYHIQNRNYVGPAEEAPSISLNAIYEKIGQNRDNFGNTFTFYVKPLANGRLNDNAIQTIDESQEISERSAHETGAIECMLCQTEAAETNYFRCSHLFCNNCIIGCRRSSISRCPFCRNSLDNAV